MAEANKKISLSPATESWVAAASKENKYNMDLIKSACQFATQNQPETPFGASTLSQGLAMADILIELNCDSYTIAAAIAYPTIFYGELEDKKTQKHFDKTVWKLLDGARHMELIHHVRGAKQRTTGQQNQIDNLRKMLLAMVDDIRTVLIKLAERLSMLQYLSHCATELQKQVAQDTKDYYAPLANRLGIGHLKWQLEDLSFRYLDNKTYLKISKALKMRRQDRENLINEMINQLKKIFEKMHLKNLNITGRAKHIYSIHRKIQRKKIDFKDIYDASAIRVLVPTIEDCYTALSLVHEKWPHIHQEFDDYIAKPKPNGYQSIHTAVTYANQSHIEIQIRTFEMHESAELGVAAHWKYKENQTAQSTYENRIAWLREVMDWQKELSEEDAENSLYTDAFKDRVYVFSLAGDVFDLSAGATPLDFAYLIHTEIGNRCRGAKVNEKLVPLTHTLQTGDRIEILTNKTGEPSRDWIRKELGYLMTAHAMRKVKNWFRRQDTEKNYEAGLTIWEKTCKSRKDIGKQDISKAFAHFNFKTPEALLAALGAGDISIGAILNYLAPKSVSEKEDKPIPLSKTTDFERPRTAADFSIKGTKHLLTQLGKCCNPIPGDSIKGYITQGRGVTVHKASCRNIAHAMKDRAERVMDISWENHTQQKYHVTLNLLTEDRPGLLRDISGLLTHMNLSISAMNSHSNALNATAFIEMTLEVSDQDSLNVLLKKLKQINGVIETSRK